MDKSIFPTLKKFAIVLLGLFLLHAAINALFFPLLEMFNASDSVTELGFKFWGYQIYLCNLIGCCFLAAEMWKRGRWNVVLLVACLFVDAGFAIILYLISLYAEKRQAACIFMLLDSPNTELSDDDCCEFGVDDSQSTYYCSVCHSVY